MESRLADIDLDGRSDIVVTGYSNNPPYPLEVNVLRNNGDGSWTRIVSPPWVVPGSTLLGDTDQDGDVDIYFQHGNNGPGGYPLSFRGSAT